MAPKSQGERWPSPGSLSRTALVNATPQLSIFICNRIYGSSFRAMNTFYHILNSWNFWIAIQDYLIAKNVILCWEPDVFYICPIERHSQTLNVLRILVSAPHQHQRWCHHPDAGAWPTSGIVAFFCVMQYFSLDLTALNCICICIYIYICIYICVCICICICIVRQTRSLYCSESVTSSGQWIPQRFIARNINQTPVHLPGNCFFLFQFR